MKLRRAGLEDAEELAKVFVEAKLGWEFLKWDYDLDFMAGIFRSRWIPTFEIWAAEIDDQIVGLISLRGDELEQLFVLPSWHGHGVGLALLNLAKARSPRGLWLWVFQQNAQARRFYEKNGFELDHLTDGLGNMEKTPDARYVWRG